MGPTMAPKLCPISWATTCHSVRPPVETAAPETIEAPLPEAFDWQLYQENGVSYQVKPGDMKFEDIQCCEPCDANFRSSGASTHKMP